MGRTVFFWTDHSRREHAIPRSEQARELAAFIYYPAKAGGDFAEYYPGLSAVKPVPDNKTLGPQFGSALPAVIAGTVQSHSYADAPIVRGREKFPILIFSPGASAPSASYSFQLEELASHGYVVVALEHAYDVPLIIAPDHRLIPYVSRRPAGSEGLPNLTYLRFDLEEVLRWVADTRFALDQVEKLSRDRGSRFFERLDLSRIGVFGHSLGGKVAARICQIDTRIRGCLNQDGEIFGIPFGEKDPVASVNRGEPMNAPFADIFIAEPLATDAQLATVHVTRQEFEDWRGLKTEALRGFLRGTGAPSYLVTVRRPGYTHGSFADILSLRAALAGSDASQARSNLQTSTAFTLAFFDAVLKNDRDRWTEIVGRPPDGVTVEAFESQQSR